MRIISGKFKGRKLLTPPGHQTRPTRDRVRQAIFNILEHRYALQYKDLKVLDAFAGTGALGIECLSRGANFCTFIEQDKEMGKILQENLSLFPHQFSLLKGNVQDQSFKDSAFDLVFLDPPYGQGWVDRVLKMLQDQRAIHPLTLIVAEIGTEEEAPHRLTPLSTHLYGVTKIIIGQRTEKE